MCKTLSKSWRRQTVTCGPLPIKAEGSGEYLLSL
jgi:hypothetical protein